jgi:hypothetical protein
MNIRKIILQQLRKELSEKDKLKSYILKNYTLKIYEIGFKKGFNLKRKK